VPTFVKQGFPSVVAIGWNALYAPAGTLKPLIDRVSVAIVRALGTPNIRERLMDLGVEPTGTTPEEEVNLDGVQSRVFESLRRDQDHSRREGEKVTVSSRGFLGTSFALAFTGEMTRQIHSVMEEA
jgi:Tripartite tricarboxylate transporter family receptor